jgi:diaminohydroxyphosphoribosylaminopyrimidine deaminase/5-amino-6-(5-phosphoribosylamino)uracil reductase
VVCGILDDENRELNEVFFHYIRTKRPFVVMKYAMTADGKIATFSGKSRWITGVEAREHVHQSRHKYAGIMVGVNTVLADDPLLNCRMPQGKDGVRIICDTRLRMPLSSQIVESARDQMTYIATASENMKQIKELESRGCRIIKTGTSHRGIDLRELMGKLADEKIDSILLEGGSALNFSALESGIVSKVQAYISPKIFGGEEGKTPVGGAGIEDPNQAFKLKRTKIELLGEDVLMEYEVRDNVYGNY